jgi:pimeloyl-ACP methyl ester carboxylesterase
VKEVHLTPITEHRFNTSTITINYAEAPSDGRPIVLLHGATSNWQSILSPLFPSLEDRWHVYALDHRGHGKSGRSGDYRMSDYTQDTVDFLQGVVKEPAVLLGHSLGGLIAMNTAAQSPALVRALILEDPAMVEYTHGPGDIPAFTYFRGVYETLNNAQSVDDILKWLRSIQPPGTPDSALLPWAETLSNLDPEVLSTILNRRITDKNTLENTLDHITCPTLLIQADPNVGATTDDRHVAMMQAHIHDLTAVQIKGSSHNIHESHLSALIQHITTFLDRLESTRID